MRPHAPLCAVLLVAAGAIGSSGCAAGDSVPSFPPDQGAASDQGVLLDLGAQLDSGPRPDIGTPTLPGVPADPAQFGAFYDAFLPLGLPDWSECFGELQDVLGCDQAPCALLASCCVANGSCGGEGASDAWPNGLTFDGCASGTGAGACLDVASIPNAPVGSTPATTSTIEARALRGGGNTEEEGGLQVGEAVDLTRERATLSVRFAHPTACDGASCLETASVSIVPEEDLATGVVRAAISLMYVGAWKEVALVVGGVRVAGWTSEEETQVFRLELSPDGRAALFRDGELLAADVTFGAPSRARLVLHGRNSELAGARIDSVTVSRNLSDMPDRWDPAIALPTPPPPSMTSWQPESASVTRGLGSTALAIAIAVDGAIQRGTLSSPGGATIDEALRIVPSETDEGRPLQDPSWWRGDDGETMLLYSVLLGSGVTDQRRVIRARHGSDGPLGDLPQNWTLVSEPSLHLDFPTMVRIGQRLVLVARATDPVTGAQAYRAFTAVHVPDRQPFFVPLSANAQASVDAVTRVTAEDAASQELGQASLLVRDGAYRLFYARRTGARWRLSLATSDEALVWRSIGEVRESTYPFDALGIVSPTALVEGDDMVLYYLGVADVGRTLVRTQQPRAQNVRHLD